MKVIYQPRQAGKTTRIIKWLEAHEGRILLVHSYEMKEMLNKKYPHLVGRILTIMDRDRLRGRKDIKEIGVDDAEYCLDRILPFPLVAITINKETPRARTTA